MTKQSNPLRKQFGRKAFNTRGKHLTVKFEHPYGSTLGYCGVWRYFR